MEYTIDSWESFDSLEQAKTRYKEILETETELFSAHIAQVEESTDCQEGFYLVVWSVYN